MSIKTRIKYHAKIKQIYGYCECGGILIDRTGKSGHKFIGCINYPKCRVTKQFKSEPNEK